MNGNGWYDNRFDDYVAANDLTGGQRHIDWLSNNALPLPGTKNYNTLYCDPSLFKKTIFPVLVKYAYRKNIRFGLAFSDASEVSAMLTYNAKQIDDSTRLRFVVTELEPYQTGKYAEMTATMQQVKTMLSGKDIPLCVYMGRPVATYWKTIFQYSSIINLHCYLKDYSPAAIKNYMDERLTDMSKSAVALGKIITVNPIFSNEPKNPISGEEFGYKYFQTHSWNDVWLNFNKAYPTDPTGVIKQGIFRGGLYGFVTKYGVQLKPLSS